MAFERAGNGFSSKFGGVGVEDVGLRSLFVNVYKYMAIALLLTGCVAYLVASVYAVAAVVFFTPLRIVFTLAPFGVVIYLSARLRYMSFNAARNWFWIYAVLMGISIAPIFLIYTGYSITKVFLISASTFGAMSLYGYTTKRSLTSMGSFMFMGLIGVVLAGFVNIFMHSEEMGFVISAVTVLVFVGLAAYDVQKLKDMYLSMGGTGDSVVGHLAIYGALTLYLDFINLFIAALRLLGSRRS